MVVVSVLGANAEWLASVDQAIHGSPMVLGSPWMENLKQSLGMGGSQKSIRCSEVVENVFRFISEHRDIFRDRIYLLFGEYYSLCCYW